MAESSILWTTDGTGDGASEYTQAELIRWLRQTFIGDNTDEGVLKNYLNELEVTDAGGANVAINTGGAYVYGFPYWNTASVQKTLDTPTGDVRIDRIVLQADWTAQTVRIAVIQGEEGGAAPSVTQTDETKWEISLAQVQIGIDGDIDSVTDERVFVHPNVEIIAAMMASVLDHDHSGDAGDGGQLAGTAALTNVPDHDHTGDAGDGAQLAGTTALTDVPDHDHTGDAGDGSQLGESALSLADNTTNDTSTTKHGFCPKLDNDSDHFLDGQGNWSAALAVPNGCLIVHPTWQEYGTEGFIGYHPSVLHDTSAGYVYYGFIVPSDFTTIEQAKIAFIAKDGATFAPDIESHYGAAGEAYNNHTGSKTDYSQAISANDVYYWDISPVLASLAAGDKVGIRVDHTDFDDGYWCELIFEYSL